MNQKMYWIVVPTKLSWSKKQSFEDRFHKSVSEGLPNETIIALVVVPSTMEELRRLITLKSVVASQLFIINPRIAMGDFLMVALTIEMAPTSAPPLFAVSVNVIQIRPLFL